MSQANHLGPLSVPLDAITAQANALIADVAAGNDGSSVIAALDTATKTSVCQRAMDLLSLPPCSGAPGSTTWTVAKGDCIDDSSNPAAYAALYTTLLPGVIKACQAQGVTVQEEMPLLVVEPAVGLVLGAVAGGFAGHHYGGHTIVGVIAGAVAGLFGGILVYDIQASRLPVQQAQS